MSNQVSQITVDTALTTRNHANSPDTGFWEVGGAAHPAPLGRVTAYLEERGPCLSSPFGGPWRLERYIGNEKRPSMKVGVAIGGSLNWKEA
jgi:hypothetical protein